MTRPAFREGRDRKVPAGGQKSYPRWPGRRGKQEPRPALRRGRGRIRVPADGLLTALTDPPAGGCTVDGFAPPHGARMRLLLEVRRNEVLLRADGGGGAGADVAVGLDDFQDALEGVITQG